MAFSIAIVLAFWWCTSRGSRTIETTNISISELRTMCKRKVAAVFASIMRHLDSMRDQGKPMHIVLIPERLKFEGWDKETLRIKGKILRVSGDADPIFVKIPNMLTILGRAISLDNDDKYAIKYALEATKKMIKVVMPELKVKKVVRRLVEAERGENPEYGYAIIHLGVKKKYQEF